MPNTTRRILQRVVGGGGGGERTTKATVVGQDGLKIDLRVVPPESYGNLLQHFTG
jgi:DNA polymerase/3'-5' exonuclease PolX